MTMGATRLLRAYLDYIEILGSKNLVARDRQFGFRNVQMRHQREPFMNTASKTLRMSHIFGMSQTH